MREGEKSIIANIDSLKPAAIQLTLECLQLGDQVVFSLLVLLEKYIGHIEIQRCAKLSNTIPGVQLKLDLAETYTQVFKFDLGNSHCSNH